MERRVAIIGSGFSGLCLGIQLKRAGLHSFTIFEKSDRIGGTWRENRYPGSACDLPAMAYCFSFEQKTDWSRKWAPAREILGYMEHCIEKHGLGPHLRLNTEIADARFDRETGVWRLRTRNGEQISADVLVCGVGQLHRPFIPEIPGLERFAGECFHSARWNHGYDLEGKTIAVIGNAASAIQLIPPIAKQAKQLYIFQRSANWMLPRNDRAFSKTERWLFTNVPLLARLYRWRLWLRQELMFPLFLGWRRAARRAREMALENMHGVISDPGLREALTPDYPIGGKRILISDDYYQTLVRDNVEVISSGIDHLTEQGVVTRDGQARPVDAVILATGFRSTEFLAPMRIEGLEGRRLDQDWKDGAQAYLGLTVAGFPNFFMLYGPNTNLGHNSIIFMIECQTNYIIKCINRLIQRDLKYLDLRQDAMDAFNARLGTELARTVWAKTPKSWYKNEAGKITNNWSGSTIRYWRRTRSVDLAAYHETSRNIAQRSPNESIATS